MSNQKTLQLQCDNCGHIWDIETWQVVDEEKDRDAVNLICDGLFFYHRCPNCNSNYCISIPTFYVDIRNKVMICFVENLLDITSMSNIITRYANELGVSMQSSHIRLTTSVNEFREKVLLFKAGLDDRAIEILKLWALELLREEGHHQEFEDVRCGINPENQKICFDFVGEQPRHIDFDRKYYDEFIDGLIEILDQETTPLEVNADWAINYVDTHDL